MWIQGRSRSIHGRSSRVAIWHCVSSLRSIAWTPTGGVIPQTRGVYPTHKGRLSHPQGKKLDWQRHVPEVSVRTSYKQHIPVASNSSDASSVLYKGVYTTSGVDAPLLSSVGSGGRLLSYLALFNKKLGGLFNKKTGGVLQHQL